MAKLSSQNVSDTDTSDMDVDEYLVTPPEEKSKPQRDRRTRATTRRRRGQRSGAKEPHREDPLSDEDTPSKRRLLKKNAVTDSPELSFLSDMTSDISSLLSWMLRLPRLLYPLWKWILILYIGWLVVTYLVAYIYVTIFDSVAAMICPLPIIGARISFCAVPVGDRAVDYSKVATSQEELVVVMDQVGQGFDMARDMVGHEFSLRDLKIRVQASNLSRKDELTREIESIIRQTKKTAKGISRYTAKVSKSIDTARTFDEYAAKALEGIMYHQRQTPSLPGRVVSVIMPLAALSIVNPSETEERVKEVFITTATRISTKVNALIGDSFELSHDLDSIQETLDRIKEITADELGELPRQAILGALWMSLIRPDDHHEYKAHKSLLEDMCRFYDSSSNVMQETIAALNRVEAELGEFRDDFATPGLTLKDYPLEVIVSLLRLSAKRLEDGKRDLERIEGGGKPLETRSGLRP